MNDKGGFIEHPYGISIIPNCIDIFPAAWYKRVMLRLFMLASAATALLGTAAAAQHDMPRVAYTREDVVGMYTIAKATLEDSTITQVESVPTLLSACVRQGYAPAARLLLDVYEGKFKGLEERPELAAKEARTIADVPVPFPDDPDCAAMQVEAMYRTALYLERGYGCTKNEQEAYRRMTKAAEAGLPKARAERARLLALGKGTPRDRKQAWEELADIARTAPDTPHVFFYLGYVSYSSGTRAGRRLAADIFYHGARHNDADCMNNLGAMFEKGIAVPQDSAKALSLYHKAAALGHRLASANMQRLSYKEGIAAHRQEAAPAGTRIRNAVKRVILILPINDKSQERLRQWLCGEPHRRP